MTSPTQPQLTELLRDIKALTPTASPRQVREVRTRARRLNRTDLLPAWVLTAPATPSSAQCTPARTAPHLRAHDPEPSLAAKARANQIPLPVLREVYCRELSNPCTASLPPGADVHAAADARVNTFIRASNGDITAPICDEDAELLSRLNY